MASKRFYWKNRESDLSKVKRYSDPNHFFEVMFYRTDLATHTKRVSLITESLVHIAQMCYVNFDPKLAILISQFHDDTEMIAKDGDVSLHIKLQMDLFQKEKKKVIELKDAKRLAKHYFEKGEPRRIDGYPYQKLLEHSVHKDIREAQLHSFADKSDGICESIHELLAGNSIFMESTWNYNQETFSKRNEKFPLIKEIFNEEVSKMSPFLRFQLLI